MRAVSGKALTGSDYSSAKLLLEMGVPLFIAKRANKEGAWDPAGGSGKTGYWFPKGWEQTDVDFAVLGNWRAGDALCAVMGHACDLVDVDPRNGGDVAALWEELGGAPEFIAVAKTPSGGEHYFIEPLEVGSRDKLRPGIDIKGGMTGGLGHGFAFICPTVRKSKEDGELRVYSWVEPPTDEETERCEPLVSLVVEAKRATDDDKGGSGNLDDYPNALAGKPCTVIVATTEKWAEKFDADDRDGRRDTMKDGIWAIIGDVSEGHSGGYQAIRGFEQVWRQEASSGKNPYPPAEAGRLWRKDLAGALEKQMAVDDDEPRGTPCAGCEALSGSGAWGVAEDGSLILPSAEAPLLVADALVAARLVDAEDRPLWLHNGTWFERLPTHWSVFDKHKQHSWLVNELGTAKTFDNKQWNVTPRHISNVESMLRGRLYQHGVSVGDWLGPDDEEPDGSLWVPMANGILDVSTMSMVDHTPAFFSTYALPFAYDPSLGGSRQWRRFMDSVELDEDSEDTLLLWIAYVLSGRTNLQKFLMISGQPRSGKGTILTVMENLLGHGNQVPTTFNKLSRNFGLASLIGVPSIVLTDASVPRLGLEQAIEVIKQITGEDPVSVEVKGASDLITRLPGRLTMAMNGIPRFIDATGALMARMIIIEMNKSFVGHEDRGLAGRLLRELPQIFNDLIPYLQRICSGEELIQPAASSAAVQMIDEGSSAFRTWSIGEGNLVLDPKGTVGRTMLKDAYNIWRSGEGLTELPAQAVYRDLKGAFPNVRDSKQNGLRLFQGVKLVDTDSTIRPSDWKGRK